MIYSYGCSFSTNYMVPLQNFWLDIVSKHFDQPYESWGNGGIDVHECFHRLTWSIRDFKAGDIVIFQFTEHHRIGLRHNNYYLSSASMKHRKYDDLLQMLHFLREVIRIDKTDDDYLTLLKFSNTWMDGQMFYNYWRVWNLLKYMEHTVGIKFIFLFLDQKWADVIPKEHYSHIPMFPIPRIIETVGYVSTPETNIALDLYCLEHKICIKHDFKYKSHPNWSASDGHPGDQGHVDIANTLIKHIKDNTWL